MDAEVSYPEVATMLVERAELMRIAAVRTLERSNNGRDLTVDELTWARHWAAQPPLTRPLGTGEPEVTEELTHPLTPREKDVLRRIVADRTMKEIARDLGISIEAVKDHAKSIYLKTGTRGRLGAALWAVRNGVYARE